MNRITTATLAAAAALSLVPIAGQAKPAAKKAKPAPSAPASAPQAAAKSWLALTDAGKYAESWSAASPTFQSQITKDQWAAAALSARGPLGKLQKRTLTSGQRASSLPGVLPGDYSVLVYAADFEKRNVATETAILTRDADGKWRISGYFIK